MGDPGVECRGGRAGRLRWDACPAAESRLCRCPRWPISRCISWSVGLGLSDRRIAVALHSVDATGHEFVARATFRSDLSGRVDLATSFSTGGSYRGVDPMGLIDTLQPVSGQSRAYFWGGQRPERFRIIVSEAGSNVASGSFTRRGRAPGVTISNESIAATGLFRPVLEATTGHPTPSRGADIRWL